MTPDPALDTARRRGEVALAGHLGDEATARSYCDDPDPAVRASVLSALVRCQAATPADTAAALTDPDPSVRRAACELAASLPGGSFAALLGDGDPMVMEAACSAVGEVRDGSAVPALVRIAGSHGDALCRESAVAALGAIGDEAGLPAVLAALDDRPQVRRRAVIALAAFEGPEPDAAIRRCLEDKDWQVRQAAEDLLGVTDEE